MVRNCFSRMRLRISVKDRRYEFSPHCGRRRRFKVTHQGTQQKGTEECGKKTKVMELHIPMCPLIFLRVSNDAMLSRVLSSRLTSVYLLNRPSISLSFFATLLPVALSEIRYVRLPFISSFIVISPASCRISSSLSSVLGLVTTLWRSFLKH